jgi:hypothetical protein
MCEKQGGGKESRTSDKHVGTRLQNVKLTPVCARVSVPATCILTLWRHATLTVSPSVLVSSSWSRFEIQVSTAFFPPMPQQPLGGLGLLIIKASRSHTLDTPHSEGLLWTSDQPVAETSNWQHTTHTRDRHPCPRWDIFFLPVRGFFPLIHICNVLKHYVLHVTFVPY